jgi:5-oxoprolinase (ATP-hydrolysing)
MLYERVVEIGGRVVIDGSEIEPLDEASAARAFAEARAAGINACAIVLMHAWKFPEHERRLADLARAAGFAQVSASHQVSALLRLVPRGDTTVVDAYLSPILRRYVEQVLSEMPGVKLYFMQSSGGLTDARAFQGKDAILSGPAGGIVGMVSTATSAGLSRVIGFDMGGTSTDVSHYAGELERAFETQVAGVRMRAPMMSIHTVAAGGGSILHFDGARLRVGPDSAGANPGPACYLRGGPLALTDANVMLGRIQPEYFPKVFGARADEMFGRDVVVARFRELAADVERGTGVPQTPETVAEGFLDIAVANIANAIKKISVARGYDVTRYALQCFGGAGGQHACRVADALGMTTVLIHPLSGVLSAYGMGLADRSVMRESSVEEPLLEETVPAISERLATVERAARSDLINQIEKSLPLRVERRVHVRYDGTDSALIIPFGDGDVESLHAAFETAYRERFGFLMNGRRLVVEAISVEAIAETDALPSQQHAVEREAPAPVTARIALWCGGSSRNADLVERERMDPGSFIVGPAIVTERNTTTVVEPGWRARVTNLDNLLLERITPRIATKVAEAADPVMLEVFNNLFMSIAEQMGAQLEKTAYSVNIKERLDFSCALFDGDGRLVANAPHIPVHLGSMSESIQAVIVRHAGTMRPGDVFVLNDPYHGGTHLPDVTVVTPAFDDAGERVLFYVGSRGHHADIGGTTPGSMPPFSTCIEEEGVRIDNFQLVKGGDLRQAELLELLASGQFPARNPEQNLADLRAQIAANEKGLKELGKMVAEFGLDVVRAYMKHVQDNAEESVRRVVTKLSDGAFTLELDNGAHISVSIRLDRGSRSATIDFAGTSAQLASNFNAPRAVCTAAVLYVFRTLVDDDIPLNAGCLAPLTIHVPEGCMLNPVPPGAVVAGNVETSMCITNALYGALGVMGASQCTMNNFTFGDARYQYYETIAGGSGAGPDFDGESVVQTHMTNSRLTDPEVLEFRFPVRLESFEIRRGSGGAGRHRGGDGAVRRVRFLQKMEASILSNGRRIPAFGMAGGQPGRVGENRIERADGRVEQLAHIASCEMMPGDVFVVESPGGGGYGSP